jgi:hypothetical protein
MGDLFAGEKQKKGINPILIVGMLIGLLLVGGAIWYLLQKPSMEKQTAELLRGSYQEGSPEFADLNKDIIISTDPNTVQSPTGLGTISMFITGKIRNKGARTISVLEVNVAVVTQFNIVLQERKMLAVPVQRPTLGPGETMPITINLTGFAKDDDRANIRWKVTAIKAQQ